MNNWKFTSYKQAGRNHDVCQDCVKIYEDDQRLVACLCDGFSSLENSHIAAAATVDTVIKLFGGLESPSVITRNGVKQVKETLIGKIKENIAQAADENGVPVDTMDCTLLFVCIFKQLNVAVIGNLGDSALCMIGETDARVLCDSSFRVNGRGAVQNEHSAHRLNLSVVRLDDDVLGFILTSCGLKNEIYYRGQDYICKGAQLYFNAVLADDPQKVIGDRVKELTDGDRSGFNDDVSVAVISRAETPVTILEEPKWPCVCGHENPLTDPLCAGCGKVFISLYKDISFDGDKTQFFRNLQENPEKKKAVLAAIGAPAAPKAETAEAPKEEAHAMEKNTPVTKGEEAAAPAETAAEAAAEETAAEAPAPKHAAPEETEGAAAPAAEQETKEDEAPEAAVEEVSFGPESEEDSAETPAEDAQPAAAEEKGGFLNSSRKVLLIAFCAGIALGAIFAALITGAVKDAQHAGKQAQMVTQPVTVQPATIAQTTVAPTAAPTTVSPETAIIGTWTPRYFLISEGENSEGERHSLDEGWTVTYDYTFTADGKVTRMGNSVKEEGTYTREGNDFIVNINDYEQRFVLSSDCRILEVESDSYDGVKTVYAKEGDDSVNEQATAPAETQNAEATTAPQSSRGQSSNEEQDDNDNGRYAYDDEDYDYED